MAIAFDAIGVPVVDILGLGYWPSAVPTWGGVNMSFLPTQASGG